jgi:hypothetical protein
MIRNLFIISLFITTTLQAVSQIGMGEWRMHIPHSKGVDVAYGNGFAMCALSSGVLAYDVNAAEYHVYDNMNGLSDIKVSCIIYHSPTKSFLVGYQNGNLDQILSDGSVINIPGIYLASGLGNKSINEFTVDGNRILVSTGFGIVVVDPSKHEIKDTYYPGNNTVAILDAEVLNDTIYALSEDACFVGAVANNFLADPNQWTSDVRFPALLAGSYGKIGVKDNELYVLKKKDVYGSDSIMKLTSGGMQMQIGDQFDMEIEDFNIVNNNLALTFSNAVLVYDGLGGLLSYIGNYQNATPNPRSAVWDGSVYWVADGLNGLVHFSNEFSYYFISKAGPPKDDFFSINAYDDKILVSSGIQDRVNFSYKRSGVYSFKDESWTLYSQDNQALWNDNMTFDLSTGAINPLNEEEMALGCYAVNGLSLVNGSTVTNVYSASNSILETTTLGNGNVCVSAVEYDENGNLWMCNGYSTKPLKVRLADGTWQEFNTGTSTVGKYTTKLAIDYNLNKWFGVYGTGLVGYNDNGTPAVTTDDTYKVLSTGEGNGNLPSDVVTAIACDFDNEIWIGTESGFVVLYNSESLFSASGVLDATKILVKYEGNVEDLLGDTPITDIEIDGGNRKWIATASTGIFLLSADGQEVISYYTKENSPLISNNILDMDFNHKTGELFIVTDLGLVSLRTDASYEDAKYETTTVFPNPVTPDYDGMITIQGIRYNSDVKITDVAGNLVYQTTSNGGTATWNGKTLTGEKVVSGVYVIWTATNEGKGKKVGKVAIVR